MAAPNHLDILAEGVEVWNRWRKVYSGTRPDLSFANLHLADLSGANLYGACLQVARLTGARLDGAMLTNAGLFETQCTTWFIQDVICEAVYWDMWRKKRTVYTLGEFERLFAEKTEIILHDADGIRPTEIAALPALILDLEADYPSCKLRLQSLLEAPGGAIVTLVVDDPGQCIPSEIVAMKTELETTGNQHIECQRQALRTAYCHWEDWEASSWTTNPK